MVTTGQEAIDRVLPTTQFDNRWTVAQKMRREHVSSGERFRIQVLPFQHGRVQGGSIISDRNSHGFFEAGGWHETDVRRGAGDSHKRQSGALFAEVDHLTIRPTAKMIHEVPNTSTRVGRRV